MPAYLLLLLISSSLSGHNCSTADDEDIKINYILVLMDSRATANSQLDLKISPKLKKKIECSFDEANFNTVCSGILKDHLKHFQSPIRVIGRTLNDTTSPKALQAIRDGLHKTHKTQGFKFQAVLVIGDAKLLSMFSVFMEDVDVSVLGLDTSGPISFTQFQGLISNSSQ